MHKILGTVWFSNATIQKYNVLYMGCIGVVAMQTFEDEWKAYIGLGSGINPELDIESIASWGSGLTREQAHGLFPQLDIEKYKKDG